MSKSVPTASPTPQVRRGFAVVDVETTGLNPAKHRVIEVAVAQVDITGQVTSRWSSLVRVDGDTGPVQVHGLTPEHLRTAPTFRELVPQLNELLAERILVAHNAAFDWAFLSHEAARAGRALPVHERLCTVNLARGLAIETPNYKLATLAEHWQIDPGRAHRAEDDVHTLVKVLNHCLDEAGRQGRALPLDPCTPPMSLSWRLRRWVASVLH